MKKIFCIPLMTVLLCLFTSCDKKSGDLLEGTWENVPGYNASTAGGLVEPQMIFIFDGKGKYSFENIDEGTTAKGTYTINKKNTIAHLHGVSRNTEGVTHEYDLELELNMDDTPPSFIINLYADTNLPDNESLLLVQLKFEKQ